MTIARNHVQTFRPLRGGIAVSNPNVNRLGTLGCIATSDGVDRWLLSAHHVLGRLDGAPVGDDEPIFQPVGPGEVVGRTRTQRSAPQLDIAAALIPGSLAVLPEVLGIGPLLGSTSPTVGMRLLKSGCATGVTEGEVVAVTQDRIEIQLPAGYPSKYELSDMSDSGAVWVEVESRRAVALHVAGNDTGTEKAFAVPMPRVLEVLALQIAVP